MEWHGSRYNIATEKAEWTSTSFHNRTTCVTLRSGRLRVNCICHACSTDPPFLATIELLLVMPIHLHKLQRTAMGFSGGRGSGGRGRGRGVVLEGRPRPTLPHALLQSLDSDSQPSSSGRGRGRGKSPGYQPGVAGRGQLRGRKAQRKNEREAKKAGKQQQQQTRKRPVESTQVGKRFWRPMCSIVHSLGCICMCRVSQHLVEAVLHPDVMSALSCRILKPKGPSHQLRSSGLGQHCCSKNVTVTSMQLRKLPSLIAGLQGPLQCALRMAAAGTQQEQRLPKPGM